jgi:P-type Ca2+ transporter type 2C
VLLSGSWVMTMLQWDARIIRATTFIGIVFGVLLLVVANRNFSQSIVKNFRFDNTWLIWMLALTALLLTVVFAIPWMRDMMGVAVPSVESYFLIAALLLAISLWLEIIGWVERTRLVSRGVAIR